MKTDTKIPGCSYWGQWSCEISMIGISNISIKIMFLKRENIQRATKKGKKQTKLNKLFAKSMDSSVTENDFCDCLMVLWAYNFVEPSFEYFVEMADF